MSCTLPALILPKGGSSSSEVHRTNSTKPSSSVLHLLQAHSGQPAPGDVYRPRGVTGSVRRPLGLIPHRRRDGVWRELSLMLSSFSNVTEKREHFTLTEGLEEVIRSDHQQEEFAVNANNECQPVVITKKIPPREPRMSAGGCEANRVVFRRQEVHEVDLDYIDMLGKCSLQKYGLDELGPVPPTEPLLVSGGQRQSMARLGTMQAKVLQGKLKRPWKFSTVGREHEYLSFSLPAQLSTRLKHTDIRDAQEHEPCERCRLRGTRCSRCKVIRTGGGYIILEAGNGENITDGQYQRGHDGTGIGCEGSRGHAGDRDGRGAGALRFGNSSTGLTGYTGDGSANSGHRSSRDLNGLSDKTLSDNSQALVGLRLGDQGGNGFLNTSGEFSSELDMTKQEGSAQDGSGHSDRDGSHTALAGEGAGRTGTEEGDRDGRASSRKGNRSARLGGSTRPGSSMRRPPSSFRRKGSILDGRDRKVRNTDFERRGRHGHGWREGDSDEEDGSGNRKAGRRQRVNGDGDDDIDGKDKRLKSAKDRRRFHLGQNEPDSNEEEGSQFDLGDLRRFKSKRDNMRALQCTLKELQGIDPLDYLAKYCIIDQEKLPNYQRVFENVDRDEDDEITILELDFALKAVNNNLISDAEMTYVHSILELAGRYALNFQLFCLVAALSEKVVSLDTMVKRLINTMDFEALEVKMKKCKELFYLLADTNDQEGVVTAAALSVELQAGGLTEEHVDFVVDRLNSNQRGIVEFLDYLTYVPLFVEIHDYISDNPLNFSRTK